MTITQHGMVASSRDFLDKQRLADYFRSFVRSWTAGPAICERWPSRLVATAAEVFGVIETALRSHFAKEISGLIKGPTMIPPASTPLI
jgi:hypothetical protein